MNIENKNNDTLISGTSEKDIINNYGSNVTINAEAGNDNIQNKGENVTINGGEGNDRIENKSSSYVIINGGAGRDYISTNGHSDLDNLDGFECVTLNGGEGKDTIFCGNYTSRALIIGDEGDDTIWTAAQSESYHTILAGDGNDTITNCSQYSLIYGGTGNDYIHLDLGGYSKKSTIVGGAGDDTIAWHVHDNDDMNSLLQYSEGDGNDVVKDIEGNSSKPKNINLSILSGSYTVTNDGEDLLVIVGDGSIRFLEKAGKLIVINGTPINSTTSTPLTTTQTLTPISTSTPTTTNNNGGTTIINTGSVYYGDVVINNNTTINETNINYITSVNNTYIYNGGDKVINNYVEGQAVQLTSDYKGIDLNGNSFFVNSSSGQLEIQNSRDKFIGYSGHDNNVVAYSYWASGGGTVDGRGKNQTEILIGGDNANNQMYAGSGGSSLWGGNGGNDTLTGGDGYDEFFYAVGSGNDVVKNASDDDVVNLLGVSLSQITYAEIKSSEINIGFTDGGKLQLQGQSATGFKLENVTYTANRSTGGWDIK